MAVFCNPVNINYRYQFNADPRLHGQLKICREAADPAMICFRGRYYIFASMTLGESPASRGIASVRLCAGRTGNGRLGLFLRVPPGREL